VRDSWLVATRCLLVDDNEDFLASASRLLESQGLEVVGTASSGDQAIELAKTLRPDVVLVDVELGEEDGVELSTRLQSGRRGPKVILISAYDQEEIAELVAPTRGVRFLPKSSLSAARIAELLAALG
jgi:two-component system nitrate/nitrite response regulator NarL